MHFVFTKRFLALATPLAGVVAALLVIMALSGTGGVTRILAVATPNNTPTTPGPGQTPNLTGVSCSQQYLDVGYPNSFPGTPDGNEDDINGDSVVNELDAVSMTMSRIEPSQTEPGKWDVTTVTYLGLDLAGGDEPGAGGFDIDVNDAIGDGPPSPSGCQTSYAAALAGPESFEFSGATNPGYANQYGIRATAVATYTPTGAGTGDLTYSTCAFSESLSVWVRVDTVTHIVKTGKAAQNDGSGTFRVAMTGPDATNAIDTNGDGIDDTARATGPGTYCAPTGGFPLGFVTQTQGRNPTTDHPLVQKNDDLNIAVDPDGPSPKLKNVEQNPDGNDGLADDWDGDGCPDWDELDKGWMYHGTSTTLLTPPLGFPPDNDWTTHPVNGMDPFNPYDCDYNWTSTISLTTTIEHNTNKCNLAALLDQSCIGNGQYFRCIGTVDHTKSGKQQPLAYKLGCYTDTTSALLGNVINTSYFTQLPAELPYVGTKKEGSANPVNSCMDTIDNDGDGKIDAADSDCRASTCPPAANTMCGDGKAGGVPPGCVPAGSTTWCAATTASPNCSSLPCPEERYVYVGIDPDSYPVVANDPASNYFDTNTNTIHLGGCFAGFGGGNFGNVFGDSTIDAHTGVGQFQIWINVTLTDCQNGTPQGVPVFTGTVSMVELKTEKGLTDAQKWDGDRDGCADARELGNGTNAQTSGGFRDPYNKYDLFNPERTNTPNGQTVADILKVVQQFNKNQGNALYTQTTDRTGIPGGQSWSLGVPDGQQTVADILAAVKQFNHNCPLVTP
jgi:hypothetical protein